MSVASLRWAMPPGAGLMGAKKLAALWTLTTRLGLQKTGGGAASSRLGADVLG